MICNKCRAVLADAPDTKFCPQCGNRLDFEDQVTSDTIVGWQGLHNDGNLDKTIILPNMADHYAPEPTQGPYTEMKTNPQMDFTANDFEQFEHFDAYGDGGMDVDSFSRDDRRQHQERPDFVNDYHKPSQETYFPNGFLQEHPNVAPPRRRHRVGALDVFTTLIGLVVLGISGYILYISRGWTLIKQFFLEDLANALQNIDDIRYFNNNQAVTWRLFFEIAALTMILVIVATIFIILHCYIKNQAIGILKAIMLLFTAFGLGALCVGYFYYFVTTITNGVPVDNETAVVVGIAGIALLVSGFIWFIYMLLWGFTSFFNGYHVSILVVQIIGFVLSIIPVIFSILVAYNICHGFLPKDALIELVSTPVALGAFMMLSLFASIEDYRAKRIVK